MNIGTQPQVVFIKTTTERTVVINPMRQAVLQRVTERLDSSGLSRTVHSILSSQLPSLTDAQLLDLLDELR